MKIIVILGPTGTGKTRLSISLAKKMDAYIINADSTQIYKEANIGTAKIKEDEMENIPHYMLNITSLNNNFTVKDYQQKGRQILNNLIKQNKNIIIVGGSFLYVKALLYDYKFSEEDKTVNSYEKYTNDELKEKVDQIYKENNIHVNNRKRLERFLNHYEKTGEIIKNNEGKDTPLYDFTLIGLTVEREKLYNYIDYRVDEMIKEGLIEETINLYKEGYKKLETLIGYKEVIKYLKKEYDLNECINEIKQNTRKYAKRQMTWLRNQFTDINWFQVDYENFNNTIKEISDFIK